ncbi:ABC transporter permease [Pseudoalteromonas sp. T1lg23B]|uniref:ABC transporter permease n=1 Tax=Pseudoalteromonas sp. T1lg23B TaxID=2077097 RepID=UPI000CF65D8F|nr:FtsX-like permease family protein [Pseudoalteromonas sp. T1lg23B]
MSELKPIFNALRRSKVGAILLLLQIAITTAIVSNSTFIIKEKIAYLDQPTGYAEQDIFSFEVMSFGKDTNFKLQAELDEQALRQIPGVVDAVMIDSVPLSGSGSSSTFRLRPTGEKSKGEQANVFQGDEHVLNTFGVKVLEGRNFYESEVMVTDNYDQYPNIALITKALADSLFPDGDALGKSIYRGDFPVKIIGITDMMKGPWLSSERKDRSVITPFVLARKLTQFMVRTEPGRRAEVMQQIEPLMLQLDGKRVVENIKGLEQVKDGFVAPDKLTMRMLLVMVVVLTLITALGIFGLTMFNINKRTKQVGTRRALGARKSHIINYFLVESVMICIGGLVLGAVLAILLGQQLMQHYSIAKLPLLYVGFTALGVLLISVCSVIGPAQRAANISPSVATRTI